MYNIIYKSLIMIICQCNYCQQNTYSNLSLQKSRVPCTYIVLIHKQNKRMYLELRIKIKISQSSHKKKKK